MPNNDHLILLDKHDVDALLTPDDALLAVREAFSLHSRGEGRVFPVIREALPAGGIFGIKAGDVPNQSLLGFKAAGFWPNNRLRGGEPHQATILLIDPHTGRPRCIIDGNSITTQRTGAAGALGLQCLARPESQRLCVFGTGVQARIQTTYALRLMPALREIRYVSIDDTPDVAFETHVQALFETHAASQSTANRCRPTLARDPDAAVAVSDVIITATPGGGPLFSAEAVQPGTHLNCVGADTRGKRELPPGLLERATLFVDDQAQARQIGESQWSPETPSRELGALLTGESVFFRQPEDITVFDMTGLALQDLTTARLLLARAMERGIGTRLAWPW